ncbi:MAG: hypothetical protein PHU85_13610 [Phycisphaerae bacterium]|nr:hypothetical protein [Phycisphaerae bacterium]
MSGFLLVRMVLPVLLATTAATAAADPQAPTPQHLRFDRFFGGGDSPFSRTVQSTSLGSGVIIHPAGDVPTNTHVVARATEVTCSSWLERRSAVLDGGPAMPARGRHACDPGEPGPSRHGTQSVVSSAIEP